MRIFRIYDNGGETFDRYTVYFSGPGTRESRHDCRARLCVGMSDNPYHPQGFYQHSGGYIGNHNGRKIRFKDLPADCQKAIREEMKGV